MAFVAQKSAVTLTTSNWYAEKRMFTKKKWRQQEHPGSSSVGSAGRKSQEGEMKSRKGPEASYGLLLWLAASKKIQEASIQQGREGLDRFKKCFILFY